MQSYFDNLITLTWIILNRCELSDAEHGAVQSVVYQFHKTWELSSQPIFLSDAKYEVIWWLAVYSVSGIPCRAPSKKSEDQLLSGSFHWH